MKNLLLLVAMIVLISSCAASKKTGPVSQPAREESAYDESFDPLSLEDDDIVISKKEKTEKVQSPADQDPQQEEPSELKEEDGFRVQIFATQSIEAATLTQQNATEQFGNLNHKTYLIFEAPFYKIRVGNFKKRSKAEAVRDLAKEMGYDQSFPVKCRVMMSPDSQFTD